MYSSAYGKGNHILEKIISIRLIRYLHYVWYRTASVYCAVFLFDHRRIANSCYPLKNQNRKEYHLRSPEMVFDPCRLKRFQDLFSRWHFTWVFNVCHGQRHEWVLNGGFICSGSFLGALVDWCPMQGI